MEKDKGQAVYGGFYPPTHSTDEIDTSQRCMMQGCSNARSDRMPVNFFGSTFEMDLCETCAKAAGKTGSS